MQQIILSSVFRFFYFHFIILFFFLVRNNELTGVQGVLVSVQYGRVLVHGLVLLLQSV